MQRRGRKLPSTDAVQYLLWYIFSKLFVVCNSCYSRHYAKSILPISILYIEGYPIKNTNEGNVSI